MGLYAPSSNNANFIRENPPVGMSMARIFRIAELGTHLKKGFQGAPDKMQRQIRIDFELPLDLMTQGDLAGKPFCVGETFAFSVHEKSGLRKKILNMLVPRMDDAKAKTFDLSKLIGTCCLVNLVESIVGDKPYVNIATVTPLMKGQKIPDDAPANPQMVYSLGDNQAFQKLPKWIQNKIMESAEMMHGEATGTDSDVPF